MVVLGAKEVLGKGSGLLGGRGRGMGAGQRLTLPDLWVKWPLLWDRLLSLELLALLVVALG